MEIPQQTILVAGPNSNQSKLICDCLEKAGYHVLVSGLDQSAVEVIREQRPDLALLDWKLPDNGILAVIRMIRSDKSLPDLPIILRGYDMKEEDLMMGLEAGADLCLKGPFRSSLFLARVRALIRRYHATEPY
jgi:DNA-binding response OmpR family regulator